MLRPSWREVAIAISVRQSDDSTLHPPCQEVGGAIFMRDGPNRPNGHNQNQKKTQNINSGGNLSDPGQNAASHTRRETASLRNSNGRGDSTFLARFGQVIVRYGVAAIPAALFHYQGKLALTAQEVWFVSAVLSRKWTADLPHPNLSKMEKQTGVPERTLRRYKQTLCASNFLEAYPRYDETGRQESNYYDFAQLFAELEDLIAADAPALPPNPIQADRDQEHGVRPYSEVDTRGTGGEVAAKIEGAGVDLRPPSGYCNPNTSNTSFAARYGSIIVSRGIATVPQALFDYQGELALTPQQVWFVCYIFSVPWSPPYPHPSLLKMAARTGYSKMQLHEIKKSLMERGLLQLVRRSKADGGQDCNGYDFAPLFETLRQYLRRDYEDTGETERGGRPSKGDLPQGGASSRPGRNQRQGKAAALRRAHLDPRSADAPSGLVGTQAVTQLTGEGDSKLTGVVVTQLTGEKVTRLTGVTDAEFTEPVRRASGTRRMAGIQGRRSQTLPKEERLESENKERDDSNHLQPIKVDGRNRIERSASPYSPYIAAVVTDFSEELQDSPHIVSNVSQSLHLWQQSGLGEGEFVELLHRAKQLTRKYQGKQGLRGIENKMGYLFKVLRDLIKKLETGS